MVDTVDKMDIKGMVNMKDITDIIRYDWDGVHVLDMMDLVNDDVVDMTNTVDKVDIMEDPMDIKHEWDETHGVPVHCGLVGQGEHVGQICCLGISEIDLDEGQIFETIFVFYEFKSSLLIIKSDRYDLSYHRHSSMVFKANINIEWNSWGQPSCSMVLGRLLGPPTIVSWWFWMHVYHRSNDPTRWTIVPV